MTDQDQGPREEPREESHEEPQNFGADAENLGGAQSQGPPPPPTDAPPPPGAALPVPENDSAKTFGMLCHLAALSAYVTGLGGIVGPLIVWLIKKDESAFVDDQGKESLNFQITVLIAAIVIGIPTCGFGAIAVGIYALIFVIIASIEANKGNAYRYPLTWRVIK